MLFARISRLITIFIRVHFSLDIAILTYIMSETRLERDTHYSTLRDITMNAYPVFTLETIQLDAREHTVGVHLFDLHYARHVRPSDPVAIQLLMDCADHCEKCKAQLNSFLYN